LARQDVDAASKVAVFGKTPADNLFGGTVVELYAFDALTRYLVI
jgi:hypothetical protein